VPAGGSAEPLRSSGKWRAEKKGGPEIRIWATDTQSRDPGSGRRGIYSASSLRNIPIGIRDDISSLFADGKWRIANCMQEEIQWNQRDLLDNASPRKDFISSF